MHKRIFISYGHDEYAGLANQLSKNLLDRGYMVWIDQERIKSGDNWSENIDKGLKWVGESREHGYVLLLMTPYSVRRPDSFCLNEMTRAIELGLKIIPIMVVKCEQPISIASIEPIDMTDCVPLKERMGRYEIKFQLLIEKLEDGGSDVEGGHARLLRLLDPLFFEAEITRHLSKFTGRQWVFDVIDRWLENSDDSKIFWMVGNPGVGKTAIASWLCFHHPEIAAYHFCKHGHTQKTDSRKIVTSLAYQLSMVLPVYKERLYRLNLENIIVESSNSATLFDNLILQPLSGNFPPPSGLVVILIDALDEAARDGHNELAELVSSEFSKTPNWLRIIVTSRPDPEVKFYLQGHSPYILDTARPENMEDLKRYVIKELEAYTESTGNVSAAIESIVFKSDGLFLYAKYVFDELSRKRLALDKPDDFPIGLGGVYAQFFKRRFPGIDHYKEKIRPVLAVVLAAVEPLETGMLAELFNLDKERLSDLLQSIGSLFPVANEAIYVFHRSVIEWLNDREKSGSYYVNVDKGHEILARYSWEQYRKRPEQMSHYVLNNLPIHLIQIHWLKKLNRLLTDRRYVQAKSSAGFDLSLLEDFSQGVRAAIRHFDTNVLFSLFRRMNRLRSKTSTEVSANHPLNLQEDIKKLIDSSAESLDKMLLLLLKAILWVHQENNEKAAGCLKTALEVGSMTIPSWWDSLLAWVLSLLSQIPGTMNDCYDLISRRSESNGNKLFTFVYNYNPAHDPNGTYKQLILRYIQRQHPSILSEIEIYFSDRFSCSLPQSRIHRKPGTSSIDRSVKRRERSLIIRTLLSFKTFFDWKNLALYHYFLKNYRETQRTGFKIRISNLVMGKQLISHLISFAIGVAAIAALGFLIFLVTRLEIIHEMSGRESGHYASLIMVSVFLYALVWMGFVGTIKTVTNYKSSFHNAVDRYSLPLFSIILAIYTSKSIDAAQSVSLKSIIFTLFWLALIYYIIGNIIIPNPLNWPWNEIGFLAELKGVKKKRLSFYKIVRLYMLQKIRDKDFPPLLMEEVSNRNLLGNRVRKWFVNSFLNKREQLFVLINDGKKTLLEKVVALSQQICSKEQIFWRVEKGIKDFGFILFIGFAFFYLMYAGIIFVFLVIYLFFPDGVEPLYMPIYIALILYLVLLLFLFDGARAALKYFLFLFSRIYYGIFIKAKLARLPLLERLKKSQLFPPQHSPAVVYVHSADVEYIKDHKILISNCIRELPTSLQIHWIYALIRTLSRTDDDVDWLIALFTNVLVTSPGTGYSYRKKAIFLRFLAVKKHDIRHTAKIQEMAEIVLKMNLYKKKKILHDILGAYGISLPIIKMVVQNLSGLSDRGYGDLFFRFSPQVRLLKKIQVRFKTMVNQVDWDFLESYILYILPYFGNYRYGKKIVRRIFKHWRQRKSE